MGVIIRQSIKSSIAIFIGVAFGIINRLFLYPLALSENQIGLIQVITSIAILLAQFGNFGYSTTITKYFQHFKSKNKISDFLGYTFTLTFFIFILFSLIFYAFKSYFFSYYKQDESILYTYTPHIILIGFYTLIGYLVSTISFNYFRVTFPSLINSVLTKILISVILIIYFFDIISFNSFILLYSSIYLIVVIIISVYLKKILQVKITLNPKKTLKKEYFKTLSYSSFVFLGAISTIITHNIDSIMLWSIIDLSATGIYSIAFFMGTVIEIPKKAISSISLPIISKNWEENNIKELDSIYKKTSINQGIIGFLLFLLLYASLDELFYLIPNPETYIAGKYVALLIGGSKVIDMLSGANSEILRTSKKYKWDFLLMGLFIVLSIALNLILIPNLGLIGAATATLTSVFLYNLIRYILLIIFYKLNPFNRQTAYLMSISLFLLGIIFFTPQLTNISTSIVSLLVIISIKTIIISSVFTFMVYKLKVSNDLNKLLDNKLFVFFRK